MKTGAGNWEATKPPHRAPGKQPPKAGDAYDETPDASVRRWARGVPRLQPAGEHRLRHAGGLPCAGRAAQPAAGDRAGAGHLLLADPAPRMGVGCREGLVDQKMTSGVAGLER